MASVQVSNVSWKRHLALMGLIGTLLSGLWIVSGAVSQADAQDFCPVLLAPYGTTYDNCSSYPSKQWNYEVYVYSQEHSACVSTTTNGWKSGLNNSWTCTAGAYSQTWKVVGACTATYGIIRNNTTSDATHANGAQWYFPSYPC